MPWNETNAMEQRTLLVKAWLSQHYTKSELSEQFNVSRPTVDKWIKRHEQVGFDGLKELSRKPHHSPKETPLWIREWLVGEKLKRPDWGAKKLLDLFARTFPNMKRPADSTGDLILERAGLVKHRKPRRHVSAYTEPFADCTEPNTTWSVDFKGQFRPGNAGWCYPLTVSDNFSRYLLLCQGLPNTKADPVIARFEQLFNEYGLPYAIRSDNGAPFASTALGGLSRLSKWWIDLGIRPERIKPANPQQNGRHERMHRSLKAALEARLTRLEQGFYAQQIVLDEFRREYNEERSHEGIGRKTPAECYVPSKRIYTGEVQPFEYNGMAEIRQVKGSGEVCWQGGVYYLSQVLAKESVAFFPYADGIWNIYYRFHFLGQMNEREKKIMPATSWHQQPKM